MKEGISSQFQVQVKYKWSRVMDSETLQVKRKRYLSAEKQRSPWLRFRWMKTATSLNRRGVYCWDKLLALTSTLHDQHETHTHTLSLRLFQSVHREVTFKVHLLHSECAGKNFVLISSNFYSHVRSFFFISFFTHLTHFESSQEQQCVHHLKVTMTLKLNCFEWAHANFKFWAILQFCKYADAVKSTN